MTTIEDKNIPSRRGQRLIQVQFIHSLPFVTAMKKIPDRFFNADGPGLPRNNWSKCQRVINNQAKRRANSSYSENQKAALYCLQETLEMDENIWSAEWGGQRIFAHG